MTGVGGMFAGSSEARSVERSAEYGVSAEERWRRR